MSEDRFLSGEEKRARLREQFKRELQKDKQLREELARARQMQTLRRQVESIEERMFTSADDAADMLTKLNEQTAWNEARLDLALEHSTTPKQVSEGSMPTSRTPSDPITDALPPHLQPVTPAPMGANLPRRLSDGTWHNPEHEVELPIVNRPKTLGNRKL
jgi:hypothetical protein